MQPLTVASDKSASGHTELSAGMVGLLTALRATHEQVLREYLCMYVSICMYVCFMHLFVKKLPEF